MTFEEWYESYDPSKFLTSHYDDLKEAFKAGSDIAKAEVSRLKQVVSSLEVYIMQMEDKIDSLEKSDD